MLNRKLSLIGVCLLTSACASLAPEPAPALDTDTERLWSETLAAKGVEATKDREPLWQRMDDPALEELVQFALARNTSIETLASRIREARFAARAELASLSPSAALGASASAQRLSESGTLPVGRIPELESEQSVFEASFDTSWEMDLYGRRGAVRNIGDAGISIAELNLEEAQQSLIADVMRVYVEYRSLQSQALLLEEIIERQERLTKSVAIRREAGEASDLDLLQSESRLTQFKARMPALVSAIRANLVSLAILTGQMPANLEARLALLRGPSASEGVLRSALSSEALRARPDVRRAEQAYVVAAKREQLAVIDLYPSFTLIASVGPNATDVSDLLDPSSLAANATSLVHWTLFDGGRRAAMRESAGERTAQAEIEYRRTVLHAIGEIETASARLDAAIADLAFSDSIGAKATSLAQMATARYQGGTGSLMEVLDAEREAAESRLEREKLRARVLTAAIAFEKAAARN
jgi:outer membrane protein, multidrug efflux system